MNSINSERFLDPTVDLAKAAGAPLPSAAERNRPHRNTSKLLAKQKADFSPFLASVLTSEDRTALKKIQKESEELIALITENAPMTIKDRFEAETLRLSRDRNVAKHLQGELKSIEERMAEGRARVRIATLALDLIIAERTKPAVLAVLEKALAVARGEREHFERVDAELWQRYGIGREETEVSRAVRDAVDALENAVSTRLGHSSGELTPRNLLGNYGITL